MKNQLMGTPRILIIVLMISAITLILIGLWEHPVQAKVYQLAGVDELSEETIREMVGTAVSDMSEYLKELTIQDSVLFGGIGVLAGDTRDRSLKKTLSYFLSETNIFAEFFEKDIGIGFLDIRETEYGEQVQDADLSNIYKYNQFFIRAFTDSFPTKRVYERKYIPFSIDFQKWLNSDHILYGYMYYSERSSDISPGILYLVLRLSKIEAHPRKGTVIPVVRHISIVSKPIIRKVDPTASTSLPKTLIELKDYLQQRPAQPAIQKPISNSTDLYNLISFNDTDLFGLLEGPARIWALLPTTAMENDPWKTVLFHDIVQSRLSSTGIHLMDTKLIWSHLYKPQNYGLSLKVSNIRQLLPNIIALSILNNTDKIDKYYYKTLYLLKCPYNDYHSDFLIRDLIYRDIFLHGNSAHLDRIVDEVFIVINKSKPFKNLLSRNSDPGIFVQNKYTHPRSDLEREVLYSIKYKLLQRILKEYDVGFSPLFKSGIPRDVKVVFELKESLWGWENLVFLSNTQQPALNMRLELEYRVEIEEKIKITPSPPKNVITDKFTTSKENIVIDYINNEIVKEIESGRANIQRQCGIGLRDFALKRADFLKNRLDDLNKKYRSISGGLLQELEKKLLYDIERCEKNKTYLIKENIQKGDIEVIFLDDTDWYDRAKINYKRADQLANEMGNDDFKEVIHRKIDDLEIYRKWNEFKILVESGEDERKQKQWNLAKKNFVKAKKISDNIGDHYRVRKSKRFQEQLKILESIFVLLDLEKLLDQALSLEREYRLAKAFQTYEKAEKLYQENYRIIKNKKYLRQINAGKSRLKDKI